MLIILNRAAVYTAISPHCISLSAPDNHNLNQCLQIASSLAKNSMHNIYHLRTAQGDIHNVVGRRFHVLLWGHLGLKRIRCKVYFRPSSFTYSDAHKTP